MCVSLAWCYTDTTHNLTSKSCFHYNVCRMRDKELLAIMTHVVLNIYHELVGYVYTPKAELHGCIHGYYISIKITLSANKYLHSNDFNYYEFRATGAN